jgi:uncharacterized protein YndB with AHSA1/START domain
MPQKGSGKLKVTRTSDLEIVLERTFAAPRHLVFEAMTKPELVKRWYCCIDGYTMPVCDIDLRVGGKWKYVIVSADGNEVCFYGEYREITPPERVVQTEIFAPFPEEVTVCTMTLEEHGGRTYYRTHVLHKTKEGCDGHINSGMEWGADIALDRLDEVAQSLATPGAARSAGGSVATSS